MDKTIPTGYDVGADLAPGASATFGYIGSIISSFPASAGSSFNIVRGGSYIIAVIGDRTLAGALVTAG